MVYLLTKLLWLSFGARNLSLITLWYIANHFRVGTYTSSVPAPLLVDSFFFFNSWLYVDLILFIFERASFGPKSLIFIASQIFMRAASLACFIR